MFKLHHNLGADLSLQRRVLLSIKKRISDYFDIKEFCHKHGFIVSTVHDKRDALIIKRQVDSDKYLIVLRPVMAIKTKNIHHSFRVGNGKVFLDSSFIVTNDEHRDEELLALLNKELPDPIEMELKERIISLNIEALLLEEYDHELDELWCYYSDAKLIVDNMNASFASALKE